MSRPSTHDDLPDYAKATVLATFQTHEIIDRPELTAAYAAFVKAAERIGGVVKDGTVTLPLTRVQLDQKLADAQRTWDTLNKRYTEVRQAVENNDLRSLEQRWQDYEHYGLRRHATEEGLPVFDLISDDNAVREVELASQLMAGC